MWLPSGLYGALPYFLMLAGLLAMGTSLGGALYFGSWYGGSALYFGGGCVALIAGAAIWQMRREHRARRQWHHGEKRED